jgi:hypothetical protein
MNRNLNEKQVGKLLFEKMTNAGLYDTFKIAASDNNWQNWKCAVVCKQCLRDDREESSASLKMLVDFQQATSASTKCVYKIEKLIRIMH